MDARTRQVIELETLAEILPELDYYALLRLPRNCPQGDIEPAFKNESRTMHPDRAARLGPDPVKKATVVYKALSEGYRVLRDPESRSQYDNELRTGNARLSDQGRQSAQQQTAAQNDPEKAARTVKGGKYWRMALQNWRDRDFKGCTMNIQFALTFEPDNATFKEWMQKAKEAAEAAKKPDNPYKIRI